MKYTPPVRRIDRGRNHWYEDANGRRVPGVTKIVDDGVPKPALITWAANATAEYALDHWGELTGMTPSTRLAMLKKARYAIRDAARNQGTRVHRLGEALVRGEEVTVPEELAGHVDSYVRFLDQWQPTAMLVEGIVISHTHGYAGTLDLIADMPGHGRWLLDVKTGRSGVYGETSMQLAGYRYADVYVTEGVERPMIPVDRCGVVHVRSDGYDLVPVEAGPAQLRYLLYAAQIVEFVEAGRSYIGEALTPPVHEVTP